ncbi:hypothetical protein HYN59_01290 [Flavobacterium album]|uniref:DUF3299 domain-containing protein n=1 Tax=Flavobacterium album TaxID=2175091 RepID=A0A2S1QTU4_9FLAO|nr:hypothetical protein [Flavobacterium album]AWH83832.1 hypothetical protein HYN59_01290 [Flavobacterium album]
MRKTLFIAALLLSGFFLASVGSPSGSIATQKNTTAPVSDTLTWKLLGQIKYIKKPSADYPEGVMYPVVNTALKAKNKKQVVMSGFIIPIDNKNYALSKNVFASCFFCGQAGPETIMGLHFKNTATKLKTDQYVTITGTFRYNDSDVDDWIYHVDNAVITKGN